MHRLLATLAMITVGCASAAVDVPEPDSVTDSQASMAPVRSISLEAFRVCAGQDYYTSETEGTLLVSIPPELKNQACLLRVAVGGENILSWRQPGQSLLSSIPIPLGTLPMGRSRVECALVVNGTELTSADAVVTRLPPKPNEVKIDNVTGGLIVDGLPFFPFGFYCYWPVQPTLADREVVNGFRHFSPYQSNDPDQIDKRREYMDRCAAIGMRVHYQLLRIAGGGGVYGADAKQSEEKRRLLKAEVEAFRDHPALLAWYISDEPTGANVPPAALARTRRLIKELDPYHPVTVVFMAPQRAREYAEAMDVVMADPYPIPHGPVTAAADATRLLIKEFAYEKPVWIVPQAFGGHEWWKREPTPQEERVMTYLALIHGASGIQYFIRHAPNSFPKSTVAWSECSRVAMEVAELTAALLSREPRPKVTCSPDTVHCGAWMDRGLVTVLAANTENRPCNVRLKLEGSAFTGMGRAPFENRAVDVVRGVIEEPIGAYGTLAYQVQVAPGPVEDSRVFPDNLMWNASYEEIASVGVPGGCYANAGEGASYFLDSRTARHGRHSLRITSPAPDRTVSLSFFPVTVTGGKPYAATIWAKAARKGVKFKMTMQGIGEREFSLTCDWREYVLAGDYPEIKGKGLLRKATARSSVGISLTTPGTAWFDLNQVYVDPVIKSRSGVFTDTLRVEIVSRCFRDGVRYTLDGTEPNAESPLYGGPITLTQTATLKARAFGAGASGGVAVEEFRKVVPREPEFVLSERGALAGGLDFAYYEGEWSWLPDFTLLSPVKTGSVDGLDLSAAQRAEHFGMKFTGYVVIPRDGLYTFYSASDDGSRLYVGGTEVVNNDGLHAVEEASGCAALKAGIHPICVTYFQGPGDKGLSVSYEGPGLEKQPIPKQALLRKARGK